MGMYSLEDEPEELDRLRIWVQCRFCSRWHTVINATWLTTPRPVCDECEETDAPVRVDMDGWPV